MYIYIYIYIYICSAVGARGPARAHVVSDIPRSNVGFVVTKDSAIPVDLRQDWSVRVSASKSLINFRYTAEKSVSKFQVHR